MICIILYLCSVLTVVNIPKVISSLLRQDKLEDTLSASLTEVVTRLQMWQRFSVVPFDVTEGRKPWDPFAGFRTQGASFFLAMILTDSERLSTRLPCIHVSTVAVGVMDA